MNQNLHLLPKNQMQLVKAAYGQFQLNSKILLRQMLVQPHLKVRKHKTWMFCEVPILKWCILKCINQKETHVYAVARV